MNAFREFSEIISLLQPVAGANNAIAHFLENPNAEALSQLFASLLNMQGEEKSHAPAVLKAARRASKVNRGRPSVLLRSSIRTTAACSPLCC